MPAALNQLHNLDCIKGMAAMPAGSVDLAFADPPFNIGYDYDVYNDRREADEYEKWSREWIEGVIRVLKPNGTFWLAIGDEFAAELKVLCTRTLGLHCRSWVVWFYTFGVHCTQKFTRSHAHLFHFVKDAKHFTFNPHAVKVPSARQLVYNDKRAAKDGRMPDDTWMIPAALLPAGASNRIKIAKSAKSSQPPEASAPAEPFDASEPVTTALPADVPMFDGFVIRPQDIPTRFPPHSDTWYFPRVAGTFAERRGWHGCQMPEQLLGRIIRACSNEGDVVLDPFGGSGTTLAVARKLNRQFIGFELSKTYARNINKRLAGINAGDPLVGPENPERSAPRTSVGRAGVRRAKGTPDEPQRAQIALFG